MANRFRRLLSFGSDSRNQNIVNSNEQRIGPIYKAPSPDNFANWVMPRMEIDTLYKALGSLFTTPPQKEPRLSQSVNLNRSINSLHTQITPKTHQNIYTMSQHAHNHTLKILESNTSLGG